MQLSLSVTKYSVYLLVNVSSYSKQLVLKHGIYPDSLFAAISVTSLPNFDRLDFGISTTSEEKYVTTRII